MVSYNGVSVLKYWMVLPMTIPRKHLTLKQKVLLGKAKQKVLYK